MVKNIVSTAVDPNSSSSYRVWGVNVPGAKVLKKIELLETPEVEQAASFLLNPKVIATRLIP